MNKNLSLYRINMIFIQLKQHTSYLVVFFIVLKKHEKVAYTTFLCLISNQTQILNNVPGGSSKENLVPSSAACNYFLLLILTKSFVHCYLPLKHTLHNTYYTIHIILHSYTTNKKTKSPQNPQTNKQTNPNPLPAKKPFETAFPMYTCYS